MNPRSYQNSLRKHDANGQKAQAQQNLEIWGIEPQAFRMQSERSTTELYPLRPVGFVAIRQANVRLLPKSKAWPSPDRSLPNLVLPLCTERWQTSCYQKQCIWRTLHTHSTIYHKESKPLICDTAERGEPPKLAFGQCGDRTHDIRVISTTL